jgi:hypothetical protein
MAFNAHKEFFDASVFLGMHGADDGVRMIRLPAENTAEKLITGYC